MANAFAELRDASFGGVVFPWQTYEIVGGIRDHVHEYPHVHGGDAEKLGRKLYEIRFSASLHAGLIPSIYRDIFPYGLRTLRRMFEAQKSDKLSIPHIGEIQAYAVSWSERASSTIVSGVDVEWTFREDASESFGQKLVVDTRKLAAAVRDWELEADVIKPTPSIFDKINDIAHTILSIKDQADLYGALIASKIEGLVSLIQEADSLVAFRDPDNHPALEALQALLAATMDLANDIMDRGQGLQVFTVPRTMSVSEVSSAIYGDSSRAAEIMELNTLDNPLAIQAGTKVVYYE